MGDDAELFGTDTADGQFYAIWKALGEFTENRDLSLYAAGAKAALLVTAEVHGESAEEADHIADLLITGLFLRDTIERKPDFKGPDGPVASPEAGHQKEGS